MLLSNIYHFHDKKPWPILPPVVTTLCMYNNVYFSVKWTEQNIQPNTKTFFSLLEEWWNATRINNWGLILEFEITNMGVDSKDV